MPNKLPFLPDEHHYAIAHVAIRAAQLDHTIEYSVKFQMLPRSGAGQFLVKNTDTNRLVGLLHALLLDNFPDRPGFINSMMTDIAAARRDRNEILHWIWGKGQDETIAEHGSFRPDRETTTKTKTAQQIYEVAEIMLKAAMVLMQLNDEWVNRHYEAAPADALTNTPEPPTPQERSASQETSNQPSTLALPGPHVIPFGEI